MRSIKLLSVAAILLASAGIAQAADGQLIIENRTDGAIWITKYFSVGMQRSARCLTAGSSVTDPHFVIDVVYLRGELKPDKYHCNGKTLSDTGKGQPIMIGKKTTKYFQASGNKLNLR